MDETFHCSTPPPQLNKRLETFYTPSALISVCPAFETASNLFVPTTIPTLQHGCIIVCPTSLVVVVNLTCPPPPQKKKKKKKIQICNSPLIPIIRKADSQLIWKNFIHIKHIKVCVRDQVDFGALAALERR